MDPFHGHNSGFHSTYTCGSQRSTNGIFMPYQFPAKVFIYFALNGAVQIIGPQDLQLKNKNIFNGNKTYQKLIWIIIQLYYYIFITYILLLFAV